MAQLLLVASYCGGPGLCPAQSMRFVVNKLAVGQVFIVDFWFSPVSIIPLVLHTHISSAGGGGLTVGLMVATVKDIVSPHQHEQHEYCYFSNLNRVTITVLSEEHKL
jgi:hypothetical protein